MGACHHIIYTNTSDAMRMQIMSGFLCFPKSQPNTKTSATSPGLFHYLPAEHNRTHKAKIHSATQKTQQKTGRALPSALACRLSQHEVQSITSLASCWRHHRHPCSEYYFHLLFFGPVFGTCLLVPHIFLVINEQWLKFLWTFPILFLLSWESCELDQCAVDTCFKQKGEVCSIFPFWRACVVWAQHSTNIRDVLVALNMYAHMLLEADSDGNKIMTH